MKFSRMQIHAGLSFYTELIKCTVYSMSQRTQAKANHKMRENSKKISSDFQEHS